MFYKKGGGGKEQLCDRYGRYSKVDKEMQNFYLYKYNIRLNDFIVKNSFDRNRLEKCLKDNNVLNNLELTDHFFDRAEFRTIKQSDFEDALINPLKITDIKIDKQAKPSFNVVGTYVTISINPTNHKITTIYCTHKK